jgi:hypothetical protein
MTRENAGDLLGDEFAEAHQNFLIEVELNELKTKSPDMVTAEGRLYFYHQVSPKSELLAGGKWIKKYGDITIVSSAVGTRPQDGIGKELRLSQTDLIRQLAMGERRRAIARGEYRGFRNLAPPVQLWPQQRLF